jgi:hypothetical protein
LKGEGTFAPSALKRGHAPFRTCKLGTA